jgi:hypothetical protein
VKVTEGVHIQNVDIRGKEKEVLYKTRNHVPRIKVQNRRHNVQTIRRHHGNEQVSEGGVRKKRHESSPVLSRINNSQINCPCTQVQHGAHNNGKQPHTKNVDPFRALRPIAKGTNDDNNHSHDIQPSEDSENNFASSMERILARNVRVFPSS